MFSLIRTSNSVETLSCRYNEGLAEFPTQYNLPVKRATVLGFLYIAIPVRIVAVYAKHGRHLSI